MVSLITAAALWSAASLATVPGQTFTISAPDVEAVLAADARQAGPRPWRYAVPVPVHLRPETVGAWTVHDQQLRWTLEVEAPGAKNLGLAFPTFALPEGATLTVAGPGGLDRRGPYSGHRPGGLWTPVIRSDRAIVMVSVPADRRADLRLDLATVQYGFRGFGAKDETAQAKSGSCNVDVVCEIADEWRNEIRSVARISISGAFLCTGQLMNNTAQDFAPYFLTASHCLSTEAEARTTTFYWNYETSECASRRTDGKLDQTSVGSTLRASSKGDSLAAPEVGPDFTLLELLEAPPAGYRVYYSGWDHRDRAPVGVTTIHHPAGDEKRISFDFDATEITAYGENAGSTLSGLQPTHLKIGDWEIGTTEGGSSGSGIWTDAHHLVGQLSGGSASCQSPLSPDWYGRFHRNWHEVPTPLHSVATWLDPGGTGAPTLDGADPNGLDLRASGDDKGLSALFGGALPLGSIVLLLYFGIPGRRRR